MGAMSRQRRQRGRRPEKGFPAKRRAPADGAKSLADRMAAVAGAAWLKRAAVAAAWAWSGWIGALQLLHGGRYINPDGVSYLDVGRVLLERRMTGGYSGYWSPLYAVLAAAGAEAAEWAGRHRLLGVQGVNLALFLAALAACAWMARRLAARSGGDPDSWRSAALQAGAMGLFCMLVVRFGGLPVVTPDVLVAGLTMAAAGLTAEIASGRTDRRLMIAAGVVMGAGCWAKAIFFPLWFWWLLLAAWLLWRREGGKRALAWALGAWLVLAAPLVVFTSRTVGRPSVGEVGRLSVLWYVSRVAAFAFWEGREAGYGTPVHPLGKLLEQPAVYWFGDRFPEATYPLWYAPWYWYEGAKPRVTPAMAAATVRTNLEVLETNFSDPQLSRMLLFSGLGWLFGLAGGAWRPRVAALLLALGPLALVLVHVEMRFLYGNLAAAWAAGAAGLASRAQGWRLAALGLLAAGAVALTVSAWRGSAMAARAGQPYAIAGIAEELRRMGVQTGARFCWIGYVPGAGELAWEMKGRVVAQMRDADYAAWMRTHGQLPATVEDAFRRAGCHLAVAMLERKDPAPPGWRRIGEWPVYVKLFEGAAGGK